MIRVANAPCSWGILEFAGSAKPAGYATVLDEIHATGYAGTELGDWGFMPTDPRRLASELAARQLQLVGAFVPIAFADESAHDAGLATALKTASLMRDAGATGAFIVLSDDNGSVPEREQQAGRIRAEHALAGRGMDDICRRRRSGRARGVGADRPAQCFSSALRRLRGNAGRDRRADAPDRSRPARPGARHRPRPLRAVATRWRCSRRTATACGMCTSRTAI